MKRPIHSFVIVAAIGGMLVSPLAEAQKPASHAQPLRIIAEQDASLSPDPGAKLAFDVQGGLHAIGSKRAITYGATGKEASAAIEANVVTLDPSSTALSLSADGREAVIATGSVLFLFDTLTGKRHDIPSQWYKPSSDASDWDVNLSADGRLFSIYSEGDDAENNAMIVRVYDWPTKTLVAKRTSDFIAAGGGFGGGVTVDGAVEFDNTRMGYKVANLKTGILIAEFGTDSVRSPDGRWTVEFPNLSWVESGPKDVLLKNGSNGKTIGKLAAHVSGDDIYGRLTGAFCGNSGRFVAADENSVGVYALPSGALLASFPASSWRQASSVNIYPDALACSSTGTRVAVLSGTRLTFHDIR